MGKGGLVTLIRDSLDYTEITPQDGIECILTIIKSDNNYITIVNLYIPPDQDIDINHISPLFTPKTVIVGDLNAKNTLWGSPVTDQRGLIIENVMDNNNFTILNNVHPTYTHHNGTRSHLDLSIVCHAFATKGDWDVLPDTLGSDHSPTVTLIFRLQKR